MKKKIITISISIIIFSLFSVAAIYKMKKDVYQIKPIVINGIENFKPEKQAIEDTYLLFYPSDVRVSQEHTIVREVNKSGEIICEYEIRDEDFRRASVHQKPTDPNQLYMSLFGEPVIENKYYTYNIDNKSFEKVELPYFTYDVGVSRIRHYGEDILFQTLVSHKTGDQVSNKDTGDFKVSISNGTKQKSYETEWGYIPDNGPLLQLDDKIFYAATLQKLDEQGLYKDAPVAVINEKTQAVEYIDFNKGANYFSTVYATPNYAYVMGNNGKLFVVDKDLNYKTFEPFSGLSKADRSYYISSASLMLSNNLAFHGIYNYESETVMLGLLSLNDTPVFTPLQKEYLNEKNSYEFLYQDVKKGLIYLKETIHNKKDGYLVVIDNKSFDLIDKIPVKYAYLLDMAIKLD